jgi:hypothetical protein
MTTIPMRDDELPRGRILDLRDDLPLKRTCLAPRIRLHLLSPTRMYLRARNVLSPLGCGHKHEAPSQSDLHGKRVDADNPMPP